MPALLFAGTFLLWSKSGTPERTAVVTTRNVHLDAKAFAFLYTVQPPTGWNVWLVTTRMTKSSTADGRDRVSGEKSQALAGRGSIRVDLKEVQFDDESLGQATASIGPAEGRTERLSPGHGAGLMEITTAAGQRVSTVLEMRPQSVATAQPAYQVYLRDLRAEPTRGFATMSYEVIEQPADYDLVVETVGASVQILPRGEVELEGATRTLEEDAVAGSLPTVTLLPGDSGAALRWAFPPSDPSHAGQCTVAEALRHRIVTPGEPMLLFDQKDDSAGIRRTATLKMIRRAGATASER